MAITTKIEAWFKVVYRWAIILILYSMVAQFALVDFIQKPYTQRYGAALVGMNGFGCAMFGDMIYGRAYRPWVYRTLMPWMVRGLRKLTPPFLQDKLEKMYDRSPFIQDKLGWEREYICEYAITVVLLFFCLLGFMFTLRKLLNLIYRPPGLITDFLPLLAGASLPIFYTYYSYIYDFPCLFLFSLGLLFLARRDWRFYYAVFAIATINKESSLLLTLIFAIQERDTLEKSHWLRHISAQIFVWIVIKSLLWAIYKDNPGHFIIATYERNLYFLVHLWPYLFFGFVSLGNYHLILPTRLNVLFLFSLLLIFYKWREKPLLLRRALWIAVPMAILSFLFGYIDEIRIYYELVPIVYLLLFHSLAIIFGLEMKLADNTHHCQKG